MKKFLIFFILLLFIPNAQAITAHRGDTITLPVSLTSTDAHAIRILFRYDEEILEVLSTDCIGPNAVFSKTAFVMWDVYNPILFDGEIGSLTVRIKDDAPYGSYDIPIILEAANGDREPTTILVEVEPIEIKCKHPRTWEFTRREADYETEGVIYIKCSECDEIVGSKIIEKLVKTPNFKNFLISILNFFFGG